jgi:hypothetical protein
MVLSYSAVAAGTRDEGGRSVKAGLEDEVSGDAASVKGDAEVEGSAKVIQVALEKAAVGEL